MKAASLPPCNRDSLLLFSGYISTKGTCKTLHQVKAYNCVHNGEHNWAAVIPHHLALSSMLQHLRRRGIRDSPAVCPKGLEGLRSPFLLLVSFLVSTQNSCSITANCTSKATPSGPVTPSQTKHFSCYCNLDEKGEMKKPSSDEKQKADVEETSNHQPGSPPHPSEGMGKFLISLNECNAVKTKKASHHLLIRPQSTSIKHQAQVSQRKKNHSLIKPQFSSYNLDCTAQAMCYPHLMELRSVMRESSEIQAFLLDAVTMCFL